MNVEDYNVTIRLQHYQDRETLTEGLRFLAYLVGDSEMTVEHVDIQTTADVNMVWALAR